MTPLVVAMIVAGAAGACSEDTGQSSQPSEKQAVIASAAGAPGTPLGDGFTVAEGTTLIGDAIPIGVKWYSDGEPVVDEGWTATAIVSGGDPIAIVEEYLTQAREAGLVDQGEATCRKRDTELTVCAGFAGAAEESDTRRLSAIVIRGPRDDVLSDHALVRFSTTDSFLTPSGQPGPVSIPPPIEWPPLSAVGDSIGTAGETRHDVVIEEGSRLAGPPLLNLEDATGGVVAILQVMGDPNSVLERYLDQMAEVGLSGSGPLSLNVGDANLTIAMVSWPGGDGFKFTLIERAGRPTWLEIKGSHD